MAKRGAKAKYESAEEFRLVVDTYFTRISYKEPAVVATPTGEVDGDGRILWTSRYLSTPPEVPGGLGRPINITKWLEVPSVAGLCLALGISRDTWARYGKQKQFADVVEWARLRIESYWVMKLTGKGAFGAKFALTNNFGWDGSWKDRQEVGLDEKTRNAVSVEQFLKKQAKTDGGRYEY